MKPTEAEPEDMSRTELIKYLVAHVYPSQPHEYKNNVHSALQKQTTPTLLAMAKVTRKSELERREKARLARAVRLANEHPHQTTHGAK